MRLARSVAWIGLWLLGAGPVAAAPDFETQVLPVLTKAGCNSGACHGAAIGRGGFRLSLLGYDPEADYASLVHEFEGRRVNRARPEKSLLLRKPSGELDHEGGLRLSPSGEGYRLVRAWIEAGSPREARRSLESLEVLPPTQLLTRTGQKFSVRVLARFSDGSREDVTRWAVFTPADSAAVRCTAQGEVTALRRGQSALMVRFLGAVGCVTVTVPLHEDPVPLAAARANFIDDSINRTLGQLGLSPAPRADDTTFVRRVYLDLIGALPDPAEVETFLAERAPDKRARLVDRLLARPEFVDYWAYKWGDLLRIESRRLQPEGAAAFHRWVREQVERNTPLDRMARELLLALGDGHQVGPANFSRVPGDARAQAEYVSQVFLGVRLQCANCHNHPLDRWTQDDYHGLAAVFARMSRGREVRLQPRGEVSHPRTGQAARPRLPGEQFLPADGDPREQLAHWLTAPDNPYLARATVNRLWRELMGRGLVEPVDDHRATNPPTHPELLDALARDFVAQGFDVRHTLRTILASEAYQRSSRATAGNQGDDRFYARALVRPLPPQVLVDAVAKVTGVPEKLGDLPAGTAARALGDSRVASVPLDLLGRCARDGGCTPAASGSGALPLALHTIHGPWLNAKIGHPQGRLHALLREERTNAAIVTALYEVALGRQPTAEERAHWEAQLAAAGTGERGKALEDFLWALLNSVEFCCNH
jgi:hypothetical protein